MRTTKQTKKPERKAGRVVAERTTIITGATSTSPGFVLPADAASVERMVEQVAQAVADHTQGSGCIPSEQSEDIAMLALAAIGIAATGKGARK